MACLGLNSRYVVVYGEEVWIGFERFYSEARYFSPSLSSRELFSWVLHVDTVRKWGETCSRFAEAKYVYTPPKLNLYT